MMTIQSRSTDTRVTAQQRWFCSLAIGVLTSLLLLASALVPNSSGFGTHEQLGLPPCTFQSVFGVRCPSCGMTTSWAHLLRGSIDESLKANLAGFLLCLLTFMSIPWLVWIAMRGTKRDLNLYLLFSIVFLTLAMFLAVLQWLSRALGIL